MPQAKKPLFDASKMFARGTKTSVGAVGLLRKVCRRHEKTFVGGTCLSEAQRHLSEAHRRLWRGLGND